MKVTRIDVEGANGMATVTRDGADLKINGSVLLHAIETRDGRACLKTEPFQLVADATDPEHQWQVARVFQQKLDGFAGAGGDVRDYARLIEMLAD